jgi:hypothetical protein
MAVALAVWAAACGILEPGRSADPGVELARARERWEGAGVQSYDLGLERMCFCAGAGPVRVEVRDGVVTGVFAQGSETPLEGSAVGAYPSVGGLFDVIQDALDRDAHSLRVVYHPILGYPTEVFIDYDEHAIDEEIGYRAELRVLGAGET